MKRLMVVLAATALFMCALSVSPVLAQPIDYCEGNYDNDLDQDGTDAFAFKQDFGRSSLLDPCPVIECQTAEQLEMRIVQLETLLAQVTALLENVTRNGNNITVSGVNVHIVDGSGDTMGTVNGLGNLIVGYNETRSDGTDNRTGSHKVVIGTRHNYASYGGLVAGRWNTVAGPYAPVTGGTNNTANSQAASVSGGANNMASSQSASVSGGRYNEASGDYSFVGGGGYTSESGGNKAFGQYSAVLGGRSNLTGDPALIDHTFAQSATVSGGAGNVASGSRSSVSGGFNNTARAWGASVSGGRYNEASGDYSFVGGGGADDASNGNKAFAHYSVILGGYFNRTGDTYGIDHTIGENSSVSGGLNNTASGLYSSVSGGSANTASDQSASVSGGMYNTADGNYSSVSGGNNREVTGSYDWRAGSLFETD